MQVLKIKLVINIFTKINQKNCLAFSQKNSFQKITVFPQLVVVFKEESHYYDELIL